MNFNTTFVSQIYSVDTKYIMHSHTKLKQLFIKKNFSNRLTMTPSLKIKSSHHHPFLFFDKKSAST